MTRLVSLATLFIAATVVLTSSCRLQSAVHVASTPAPAPRVPVPTAVPELPPLAAEPELIPRRVRVRVTACSPLDSPRDISYYEKYGYEGATYGIAADPRVFPRGTLIRVPGYMEASYPGKFWAVDSKGGSVIRASTARGLKHIDVKFSTLHSVVQWGSQDMVLDVITPTAQRQWEDAHEKWEQDREDRNHELRLRDDIRKAEHGGIRDLPEVR